MKPKKLCVACLTKCASGGEFCSRLFYLAAAGDEAEPIGLRRVGRDKSFEKTFSKVFFFSEILCINAAKSRFCFDVWVKVHHLWL